jgi:uncharacterized protein YjbI with pentapeptide repeats
MSSSPPTEAPATAAFVCDCTEWARPVCKGLPFYKKHEGKQYCVLHYPSKDKSVAFNEVLKRKLDAKDFDLRGVWFPDTVDFSNFIFTTPAIFDHATFSASVKFYSAKFGAKAHFHLAMFSVEAIFDSAKFSAGADFGSARFSAVALFHGAMFSKEVKFTSTSFSSADFRYVTFSAEADFSHAKLSADADFSFATFSAEADFRFVKFNTPAHFRSATFKDYVRFAGSRENKVFGDNSLLNLHFARIEKPDRFSFHTLRLRPHWFVNVDARKFEFIAVNWNWRDINVKQEIKSLQSNEVFPAHRLLEIACRNLAVNAEENHRYERASRFRYIAMEARRLERWRGFAFWTLGWWYWLASGYGERIWRAFVVLIGIWLIAAALYTGVGFARWEPRVATEKEAAEARRDVVGEPLRLPRALTYSLGVMTLQKPEPRPATNAAQSLVMLETILGPVQAALLALAIRRKFMR